MKKRSIAFLLSLVMLLSLLTPTALAEEPDQEAQATEERTEIPALSETTVAVPREAAFGDETTVTAPAGAESYQWQFRLMEGLWVNISGDESAAIVLTYAKVCNMLDESGAASLRCLVDGAASETLTVTVTDEPAQEPGAAEEPDEAPVPDEEPVLDEEPVAQPVLPVLDPQQSAEDTIVSVSNSAVGAQEGNGDEDVVAQDETPNPGDLTSYTVTVRFRIQGKDEDASDPRVFSVPAGTVLSETITLPEIVGYEYQDANGKVQTEYSLNETVEADKIIILEYVPAEVGYTINYYWQKVDADDSGDRENNYELHESESRKARTGSDTPSGLNKTTTYDGFYGLNYSAEKVAADGSTTLNIYYDRFYYLISIDLNGGYGVEPIYDRYGAEVVIGTPTRAGYKFKGWDKEIPATMPYGGDKLTAQWEAANTSFTVVYWTENADDTDYSAVATASYGENSGEKVSISGYTTLPSSVKDRSYFTYDSATTQEKNGGTQVIVAGDGSTVVNVYFSRKTYTLTFQVWERSGFFGWGSWKTVTTITAKYNAKISDEFQKAPFNTTYAGRAWECTDSKKYDYALQTLDRMPGFDATFHLYDKSSNTKKTIYYYVQKVGTTVNANQWPTSTTNFDLLKSVGTYFNYATYEEEYHEIQGFTRYAKNISFNETYGSAKGVKNFKNNALNLYYMRNSYQLKFYNYKTELGDRAETVQYAASLSGHGNFTPPYPDTLEKDAYFFDGWCLDEKCQVQADLEKMTMPASDLILYAKWVPKNHTVTTWLTDEMNVPVNVEVNGVETNRQIVPHNNTATKPEDPTREKYTFVAWFYRDENGVEHAFDFSAPVTHDMNLYAKWFSDEVVDYTIRYVFKDDGTEIAAPTTDSAVAGSSRTVYAKGGNELYEAYRQGYFPEVSSHNFTVQVEGDNSYTFYYVKAQDVPYTVKYLEVGTEKELAKPKSGTSNYAMITETYLYIQNYRPDAYQKTLILQKDGTNELIFWYTQDTTHAPVTIIHWVQNSSGTSYTEYSKRTDIQGVIDEEYSEAPMTIPGYVYVNGTAALADGTIQATFGADAEKVSATLTEKGLVLNLYYDLQTYPYIFKFVDRDTNQEIADRVTGSEKYGISVTKNAKIIDGYQLVSADQLTIRIAIEDPADTASKNVKTFYYSEQTVEIKYEVVGPTGCGTLDNYQEAQLKVITGTASGSVPTAAAGFKFVGWFKDADCTQAVDETWVANNKLTPGKTVKYGEKDGYEAATYYAKFEPDVADLTISKRGCADIDENQSFIFTVTGGELPEAGLKVVVKGNGSVTIKGLKVGTTYTITEDTGWSWRYTPEDGEQKKTLDVDKSKNTVIFSNERTEPKWLNGCSIKVNNWKKKAGEESPETN